MPNDPILHMLGLARKAGRLEIGEEPVGAACRARQAKLVLLAKRSFYQVINQKLGGFVP